MNTTSNCIHEPARDVPVIDEADICVLGGSCTGVFAAVRAARLGARVSIVEQHNCFGGVATLSLVNVWHSLYDTEFSQRIIAGLTEEVIARLKRRDAVVERSQSPHWAYAFNPQELQIELDELVREARVTPHLHTRFVAPHLEDGALTAVIVESKSGRGASKARYFIDATGDGDLAARLGLTCYTAEQAQPCTTCATIAGWSALDGTDVERLVCEHAHEFNLPEGFAWGCFIPHSDVYMRAGTRVYGADCTDAAALTRAEMEGRRQVRAFMDLLRAQAPQARLTLQALPARIGIRESRHVRCLHQLTGAEVLSGQRFEDAIANGSYRVDVHHQDKPGITLKYLDGREEYHRPGAPVAAGRWRAATSVNPTFYQVPYRALVPRGSRNVLVAGRMLDAEAEAFAAVRVMVNLNQTGEAAGVAAHLALQRGADVGEVDAAELRAALAAGGSVVL